MRPMTVAAPAGSPMPSIMSSGLRPNMSMVIWHGMNSTPERLGGFEELLRAGDAVLLRQAAHHPGPHPEEVHLRQLPMADAGALHRRHHLLHPVLAGDPLRVLDEDLEAPEGHEDAGSDAHRGARGGEDHRGPDLLEVAAVVDDQDVAGLDCAPGRGGGQVRRLVDGFGRLRPALDRSEGVGERVDRGQCAMWSWDEPHFRRMTKW